MLKKDPRLKSFHSVVVHGSFTKAADALGLTQQAVSFQLKSLEDELGTRLLQRSAKGIVPTETGEILFRYAKQIIELYAAAEDAIAQRSGTLGGSLNIGATGSIAKYCLPSAIGEFRKSFDKVSISVSIANSDGVTDMLAREAVDLGIVSGGNVVLDKFVVEPFFDDELVFVSSANSALAKKKSVSLQDLAEAPFVIREPGSGTRQLMDGYFRDRGLEPTKLRVWVTVGSTEMVKAAVSANAGIAMVSRLSLQEHVDQPLTVLDVEAGTLVRSFYIVRPREAYMRRLVEAFIRVLRGGGVDRRHLETQLRVV